MNARVLIDPQVLGAQRSQLQAELAAPPAGGYSSPRWISCTACGAYFGDDCRREEGFCEQRIAQNRQRLAELPTWARPWSSPCCSRVVWLVWRTAEDDLRWDGVPCFGCAATFTIEAHASDAATVDARVRVDRIHPEHVEVFAWASETGNPWQK